MKMILYSLNGIEGRHLNEAKEKIKMYGRIVEIEGTETFVLFESELDWDALRDIFRGLGSVATREQGGNDEG